MFFKWTMPSHHALRCSICLSVLLFSLFCLPTTQAKDTAVVTTSRPVLAASHETLHLSGSLSSLQQALLSTKVDGLVTQLNVDAGDHVKKGDALLVLDNKLALLELAQKQAATAQAQASLNEARRQVEEAERLIKQRHISESELAKRRSTLQLEQATVLAAKAAENTTQELLKRHTLIAPFSGVISHKSTEIGEWISRGDTVLTLVNTQQIRLDIYVPQERFTDIHPDSPVHIIADTYPGQKFKGKIDAIVPVSDPKARAFLVRIVIPNNDIQLFPGTSAVAEFDLQNKQKPLLIIPRDALLLHPDGGYSVFVVRDNTAWRQAVKLAQFTNQGALIESGLKLEDNVVIRGNEVLRNQQAVHVISP